MQAAHGQLLAVTQDRAPVRPGVQDAVAITSASVSCDCNHAVTQSMRGLGLFFLGPRNFRKREIYRSLRK